MRSRDFVFDKRYDELADIQTNNRKNEVDQAIITNIEIINSEQKNENQQNFQLKITLSTDYYSNKIEIELDGKTFITYKKNQIFEQWLFYADVYVDISTIVRLEENFKITAKLINIASGNETNRKSINVKVFKNGGVSKTDQDVDNNFNGIGCGIEYRDKIKCYKYKTKYGPVYLGTLKMSNYSKWDELVASNKITNDEKNIVVAMSENEGNLDAINGYDDQIVSIGAMQKTVNQQGYGELPIQIWEFGLEYPLKYKSLLLDCGWKVEEEIETNNGKEIVNYKIYYNEISGLNLYKKIRIGFTKEKQGQKIVCIPIEPLIKLSKDEDFQTKQIEDFVDRMNQSLQKKPKTYSNKISDFTKSNLGKALVLDNDVNRPAQTKTCFGEALNIFFKKNTNISKNPNEWNENHSNYESEILKIYGPLRGRDFGKKKGAFTMTDAKGRFTKLKAKLS